MPKVIDVSLGTRNNGGPATQDWLFKVGQKDDQAGHAIGRHIGGRGGLYSGNIFPLARNQNQNGGQYYDAEMKVVAARKANPDADICIFLAFRYATPKAIRPSSILFVYTVDKAVVATPIPKT